MRPLTLQEFAEDMRRKGDIRNTDLADEILDLIALEEEVAEPYSNMLADLDIYTPTEVPSEKSVEWLGDRSNLLADVEKLLEEADRGVRDPDDAVKELLGTLAAAEKILEEHGWPGTDFLDALENLAEATPNPTEYDL